MLTKGEKVLEEDEIIKIDRYAPLMNRTTVPCSLTHTQVLPFLHASRERTTFVSVRIILLRLNLILHIRVTVVHVVLIAVVFSSVPTWKKFIRVIITFKILLEQQE